MPKVKKVNKKTTEMPAKKSEKGPIGKLMSLIFWVAGVLVALAVGFGMIDGVLAVRYIPDVVTAVAGWVVVIFTLLGVILRILDLGR
jgi:uncharacterized membrane protein YdbT with pleckstrin-like domain